MRQILPELPRVHFARDVMPGLLVRPDTDLLTSKKRYVWPERRRRVGSDAVLADGQETCAVPSHNTQCVLGHRSARSEEYCGDGLMWNCVIAGFELVEPRSPEPE